MTGINLPLDARAKWAVSDVRHAQEVVRALQAQGFRPTKSVDYDIRRFNGVVTILVFNGKIQTKLHPSKDNASWWHHYSERYTDLTRSRDWSLQSLINTPASLMTSGGDAAKSEDPIEKLIREMREKSQRNFRELDIQ